MQMLELAKQIEAAQRARRLERHSRPWLPAATPASSLGYACERRIVYQRTQPEQAGRISEELASIFEEGKQHEQSVRRELGELGFEVVESETPFRDDRLDVAGTIDGKIALPGDTNTHTQRRVPVEIKSTTGEKMMSEHDWRNSETPLLRRYYAQLTMYLYLTNSPEGLGLFKDKITGLWALVPCTLDYAYAEALLRRAERVRDAVRAVKERGDEALPARLLDRSECDGCPWRDTLCHPAEAAIDPTLLAEDTTLLAQLSEREQCDAAATRFDKIDKAIKGRFKLTRGERFVVGGPGGFLVTKKVGATQTRITIKRLASVPESQSEAAE